MICTRCKVEKPETVEFFPPHNRKRNGLDSWCRQCRNSYRNANCRGRYRASISDALLAGIRSSVTECVICGTGGKLVVDHCHKTGKVRGMLCQPCNLGLGKFRDDPELMEYAAAYVREMAE